MIDLVEVLCNLVGCMIFQCIFILVPLGHVLNEGHGCFWNWVDKSCFLLPVGFLLIGIGAGCDYAYTDFSMLWCMNILAKTLLVLILVLAVIGCLGSIIGRVFDNIHAATEAVKSYLDQVATKRDIADLRYAISSHLSNQMKHISLIEDRIVTLRNNQQKLERFIETYCQR